MHSHTSSSIVLNEITKKLINEDIKTSFTMSSFQLKDKALELLNNAGVSIPHEPGKPFPIIAQRLAKSTARNRPLVLLPSSGL